MSDLEDRLLDWSKTPEAARAMYLAWAESLRADHQMIDRHHARWEILEPKDQQHHSLMAQAFVGLALGALEEVRHD